MQAEPLFDRGDDGGLVGQVFCREVEFTCQGGVVRGQPGGIFGAQPPDQVVLEGEAVGVFQGGLGFADAAEAVEVLGEDGGAFLVQSVVEGGEQVLPAGEVGVAGWGTFQMVGTWPGKRG